MTSCRTLVLSVLPLLLASGFAAAQSDSPQPDRINRNPVFRESLPPAPPAPPDPRDSTSRPVLPLGSDERDAVLAHASPASQPAGSAPTMVITPATRAR